MNPARTIRPRFFLITPSVLTDQDDMTAATRDDSDFARLLDVRLNERSLAPRVAPALESLGYTLFAPDGNTDADARARADRGSAHSEDRASSPRIWLVDEDRLDEMPSVDEAPDDRFLMIAAPRQIRSTDPRILEWIPRPARLAAIYASLQRSIERNPRRMPRIDTRLSARCIRRDRRAIGAVLSLSEGGCLLRTTEKLRKGSRVDLQFALPDYGLVSTSAQCRYRRKGDSGMVFDDPAADIRNTIAHFVTLQLAEIAGSSATDAI